MRLAHARRRAVPVVTIVVVLLGLSFAASASAALPALILPPTISGKAQARRTLAAVNGQWRSDRGGIAYTYQWRRCNRRGLGCRAITGARGNVWDVFAEDAGRTFRVTVTARNRSGFRSVTSKASARVPQSGGIPTGAGDPTIAAAGDIACDPQRLAITPTQCQHKATSDVLLRIRPTSVLALGDTQYECGDPEDYPSFDATWGRLKSIIRPIPGNKEYHYQLNPGECANTAAAPGEGYFQYFGTAAGETGAGYYSFDLGSWHLIALNAECPFVACDRGSPQEQWLRADLAANRKPCVLAFWHQPRFEGARRVTRQLDYGAFWDDLIAARADVVLNAHIHDYERHALLRTNGTRTPTGIRQFIVGTGGRSEIGPSFVRPETGIEVLWRKTFGVLQMTLHPSGYSWQFIPAAGVFTDKGSARCHA